MLDLGYTVKYSPLPLGVPSDGGIYLTVYPSSSPNMDTVKDSLPYSQGQSTLQWMRVYYTVLWLASIGYWTLEVNTRHQHIGKFKWKVI